MCIYSKTGLETKQSVKRNVAISLNTFLLSWLSGQFFRVRLKPVVSRSCSCGDSSQKNIATPAEVAACVGTHQQFIIT